MLMYTYLSMCAGPEEHAKAEGEAVSISTNTLRQHHQR